MLQWMNTSYMAQGASCDAHRHSAWKEILSYTQHSLQTHKDYYRKHTIVFVNNRKIYLQTLVNQSYTHLTYFKADTEYVN